MSATKYQYGPEQFFNSDAYKPFAKASGYNFEEATASQRKNMEAFTKASQEAAEAAKTLAHCQANFARESMEDMTAFWRNWISSGSNMQDKAEVQNQAAREGIAKAVAHGKEVTAIVQKTQEKVMHAFAHQASENMNTKEKQATKSTHKTTKSTQKSPKSTQKAPKSTQKATKSAQKATKSAQQETKSPYQHAMSSTQSAHKTHN
jgi:phasin family protein